MTDPGLKATVIMLVLLAVGGVLALMELLSRRKNPEWPMHRYIGADGSEYVWLPPRSDPGGA